MLCNILIILCSNVMGLTTGFPSTLSENTENNEVVSYDFPFVSRSQWHARQAKEKTPLHTPVPYVVIHHSHMPEACYTGEQCQKAMRSMQNFHMDDRNWWDIGYHFGIGSDGAAYEGRGWEVLGAHALHFNSVSIGICLIGDWSNELPPEEQIKTAKSVIAAGVEMGYIKPDYKLVGHRQVRATLCPGDALYNLIKTWDHYSEHPSSVSELIDVPELPVDVKAKLLNSSKELILANNAANITPWALLFIVILGLV